MMARLMGLRTVSPEEVLRLTRDGAASVLDVNAPGGWLQARVPGAVNIDPVTFDVSVLPVDRASILVFYCSNPLCRKAPIAAVRARRLECEHVPAMSAGIKGWLRARLPVESGPVVG
jgi:rhodanese-related sulfurtransferase